ncbi:polysaccharide biosynthesis protein [Alkalibacillus silvisoli]|uniref:Polysaccharide biosynthesis protein n=1 Tax=Alkalibacillus silvisoli TaxID=392823 RepID=A0ABN1A4G4_9BACI
MSKSDTWIKGTVILAIAGLIGKVLGMVYRIPLQNLAGDEGLYIYQQVYPVISLALILSIYSLPSAFSHVLTYYTSQNAQIRYKNVSVVFYLLVVIGFSLFLIIYFMAPLLVQLMGDSSLLWPLRSTSVLFLLIPVTAFFRGVFQFQQQTNVVALSQVIEQFIRVILIVISTIVIVHFNYSLYHIGWIASASTILGMIVASAVLLIVFRKRNISNQQATDINLRLILASLLTGIVIYSLTHILHLIVQLVDVFTMINSLRHYGVTFEEAKILKGIYDRGNPLIQLGLVFAAALAFSIVPAVQNQEAIQSKQSVWNQVFAFKLTLLFSLSASAGLIAIMPLLNPLFYQSSDGTVAIQLMVVLVFLLSMIMTLSVMLQAHGVRLKQVKYLVLLFVIKAILNLILIQQYGIVGASVASIIAAIVVVIIFYKKWASKLSLNGVYPFILKSVAIVFVMMLAVSSSTSLLSLVIPTDERVLLLLVVLGLCVMGVMIVIYLIYKWRLFTKEEQEILEGLPLINKLRK